MNYLEQIYELQSVGLEGTLEKTLKQFFRMLMR